jgi:hypothetical protein
MDPLQAKLNLEADLGLIAGVIKEYAWEVQPWPITGSAFVVSMASVVDGERYSISLMCDDYPEKPPSIRCVNAAANDPGDLKAWPNCDGFRPPPTADLCLSISREGLTQIHPDWSKDARYAWTTDGNPIWYVLSSLQDRLNDPAKYHGRQK